MYTNIALRPLQFLGVWYLQFTQLRRQISLPLLLLLALLQRAPVVQAFLGQASNLVASSPAQVLRSSLGLAAVLGAVDTLAGATTFVISPTGNPEGTYNLAVGTSVNVTFTVTDTPTPVVSWRTQGTLAPGLSIAGMSGTIINVADPVITGTLTTAGTYLFEVKAYDKLNGSGKTDGVWNPITFIVTGPPATAPTITTQPAAQTVSAGGTASFSVVAVGSPALTYQWLFNGAAISGATSSSYSLTNAQSANAGNYSVTITNGAGSVTSTAASLTVNPVSALPVITLQPLGGKVVLGQVVVLNARATGATSYQWYKGGTALSGQTNDNLVISNVTSSTAGTYTLMATNGAGSVTSSAAVLSIDKNQRAPVVNVSALTTSIAGDPFTLGFVVSGDVSQTVLIRASGPSIAHLVPGTMADPVMKVFNHAQAVIAENDNWSANLASIFTKTGAFAFLPGSKDAALVITLPPGNYTVEVIDANRATGKALAEVFLVEHPVND